MYRVLFYGAEPTPAQALRLLTVNPASMTGLGDQAGSLTAGQAANLVSIDAAGKLVGAIVNGRTAFGRR